MASLRIGDSIIGVGVDSPDEVSAPATVNQSRELELTSGARLADAVLSVAASTTVTLWQATNHGVSSADPSCLLAGVIVDPAQELDDTLALDIICTDTDVSSTTTTADGNYRELYREDGLLKCVNGRKSDATQRHLTKIEAKNRSTDTAVKARVIVWG